jgi:type VI secretion system protein ImpA
MADRIYFSDELLQPISPENPAGRDLRYEPVFRQILDARRADDPLLDVGAWAKEEGPKVAEWDQVADLSLDALKASSKDLRLVCFLTEAAIHLDGFVGLRDCLRLTKELLYRFWDQGLFPTVEGGDLDDRASSLEWLNDRMPDVVHLVPITSRDGRDGKEENYSFLHYLQARSIGREDSIQRASEEFREKIKGRLQRGWITLDTFEAAMKATGRKEFEAIYQPFEEAYEQFSALKKVVDEKFGEAAPGFTTVKEAFEEMRREMGATLKKKREAEPDKPVAGEQPDGAQSRTAVAGFWTAGMPTDASDSWQEAEALVRIGNVDQGLQRMAALAAQETSDRARFFRKLMLVDVCRSAGRDRLARTVLVELDGQIKEYKLDQWESTALVGAVWSRLYRLYKNSEIKSEQEQAAALYDQLCRLDPWQAYLDCED